jgi:hypothetical protein
MKNKLLATVAVAAVVGFGGFAAAQSQMGGESNKATSGTTQEKSGGSMSGSQSGSKTLSPSSGQSSNPSKNAQQKSGKDNERLGQGRNEEQKEMTRGAQEEKRGTEQKGAQQERGMQKNQKGAQEERGKNLTSSTRAAFAAKPWTASLYVPWIASTRARICSSSILTNASTVAFVNQNVPSMPLRLIPDQGLRNGCR